MQTWPKLWDTHTHTPVARCQWSKQKGMKKGTKRGRGEGRGKCGIKTDSLWKAFWNETAHMPVASCQLPVASSQLPVGMWQLTYLPYSNLSYPILYLTLPSRRVLRQRSDEPKTDLCSESQVKCVRFSLGSARRNQFDICSTWCGPPPLAPLAPSGKHVPPRPVACGSLIEARPAESCDSATLNEDKLRNKKRKFA